MRAIPGKGARWCGLAVLLGVSALNLNGQGTYGAIIGSARDTTGAVMPGVTVSVTSERTGQTSQQATNEVGAYSFTTLFPDTYLIRAEAVGFRPVNINGITLQVNQTARYDLAMQVGDVTETIEVTSSAPVLSTDTSDVGQVIENQKVVNLPLNGRNFLQLAALSQSIILTGQTESGGPNFVGQGGRVTQNSFLIEGVETRIQREGGYGLNLSVDAIQEFKVMQNSFSAEYGRGTTIINAAVKSGGNQFHGTVYEFLRNDKLDARNAFDLTGSQPPLRFNQFGANVGGPIQSDKLFFFVNYEGQRIRRSETRFSNVPTDAMFNGDFSGMSAVLDPSTGQPFPDNRIPQNRISQFANAGREYYPAPNSTVLPNSNYLAVVPNPTEMNQVTTRIDYNISEKDRLNGTITFFKYDRTSTGTLPFSGTKTSSETEPSISLQYTHTFGPSLLNDFRFGSNRTKTFVGADQLLDAPVLDAFGLRNLSPEPAAYAPPGISIVGFGYTGHPQWIPNGATDTLRQFTDTVTYLRGRHTLKFGVDARIYKYDDLGYAIQNGAYTFNGQYAGLPMADYLLGLPNAATSHQAGGSGFTQRLRNGEYSFFLQEDWKVTENLAINAGLRYEYVQIPLEANDELASWNFQKGTLDFAGRDIPRRIVNADLNNWGPRLGFAYTPSFSPKTVIRSGAAIMYGNYRQWEISLFHFQPPFVYENFFFNDASSPRFRTDTLWPAVETDVSKVDFTQVTANYQSPDKVVPLTYQWNFNIQHEVARNLLVEVGYVGNRGARQPNRWDANGARPDADLSNRTPIQSRRPYQNVGFVSGNTSRAWSNYNALNVRLEKRYSAGLTLLSNYTWSKAMGIRGHDNWTVMDIDNIRINYGPMNDFTHRWIMSYVWDLPFGPGKPFLGDARGVLGHIVGGWQTNGIVNLLSGAALSTSSPVGNDLGNRAGNRPHRIADGNLESDSRTVERWFDTAAFVNPAVGRYGNSGDGVLRGPGLASFDLSLFKNFTLAESKTLQFRFEFFNAFNHVNFNNPSTNTGDARFGRITGSGPSRAIQVGLKFLF
ncbi:MAG: TonB-dependent receptor [Bryobacterales bacterium]